MSIRYLIAGSVLADNVTVSIKGPINTLETAADGSFSTMECEVLDPGGTLAFKQLATFVVEETDCSDPRSFMGMIFNVKIDRGPYLTGAGRRWTFTVQDVNYVLGLRRLHGASANRPVESGTARLTWLLSSVALSGLAADLGHIMANAWTYDKADYRGKLATDVLADIVGAASSGRWTFFAYWDPSALAVGLFYGEANNVTLRPSTLSLSNVPGDANGTTVFDVHPSPELEGRGEDIYDGVYSVGEGNTSIYRQRAATFAEFGIHRDGLYESARNNNATSIALHAERFLDTHNGQQETVTATVRLPSTKVNLITAGMILPVRFQHLPGWGSYVNARVAKRSFSMAVERSKLVYDVTLILTNKGWMTPGGGGNPGDFPHVPPTNPTYNQSAYATTTASTGPSSLTASFGAAPLATDILVGLAQCGGALVRTWPAGFTEIDSGTTWSLVVGTGITTAGITVGFSSGTAVHPVVAIVAVRGGAYETKTSRTEPGSPGSTTPALPSITPTPGNAAVIVALAATFQGYGLTVDPSGYTNRINQVSNDGVGSTRIAAWTKTVNPTSGAYTGSPTYANVVQGDLHQVVISGTASGDNPPSPGQPVPRSSVTPAADGTTTVFTTPNPYADSSLHVEFNGVELDPGVDFTETSGALGTFTFTHAPPVGAEIIVWYQGR